MHHFLPFEDSVAIVRKKRKCVKISFYRFTMLVMVRLITPLPVLGETKKWVDWDTDYENLISDSNSNLKKKMRFTFYDHIPSILDIAVQYLGT